MSGACLLQDDDKDDCSWGDNQFKRCSNGPPNLKREWRGGGGGGSENVSIVVVGHQQFHSIVRDVDNEDQRYNTQARYIAVWSHVTSESTDTMYVKAPTECQ